MLLNLVEYSKNNRKRLLNTFVSKNSQGNYQLVNVGSQDSGIENSATTTFLDVFVEMFLYRERAAKKEELHTDNILDKGAANQSAGSSNAGHSSQIKSSSNSSEKNSQDAEGSSVQDLIDKLIQTAGKHMENSLIAAYIALLLGYLIMDDPVSQFYHDVSLVSFIYIIYMEYIVVIANFLIV